MAVALCAGTGKGGSSAEYYLVVVRSARDDKHMIRGSMGSEGVEEAQPGAGFIKDVSVISGGITGLST